MITGNDRVLVKLNDIGKKIIDELNADFARRHPAIFGKITYKYDSDGLFETPMWEFMQIFGGDNIGLGKLLPFDHLVKL